MKKFARYLICFLLFGSIFAGSFLFVSDITGLVIISIPSGVRVGIIEEVPPVEENVTVNITLENDTSFNIKIDEYGISKGHEKPETKLNDSDKAVICSELYPIIKNESKFEEFKSNPEKVETLTVFLQESFEVNVSSYQVSLVAENFEEECFGQLFAGDVNLRIKNIIPTYYIIPVVFVFGGLFSLAVYLLINYYLRRKNRK